MTQPSAVGLRECEGAAQIVDSMRSWFDGAEEFEVLDLLCSGFQPDARS